MIQVRGYSRAGNLGLPIACSAVALADHPTDERGVN